MTDLDLIQMKMQGVFIVIILAAPLKKYHYQSKESFLQTKFSEED